MRTTSEPFIGRSRAQEHVSSADLRLKASRLVQFSSSTSPETPVEADPIFRLRKPHSRARRLVGFCGEFGAKKTTRRLLHILRLNWMKVSEGRLLVTLRGEVESPHTYSSLPLRETLQLLRNREDPENTPR